MSATILPFKAPDRASQPAPATGQQAAILALLRKISAALDARKRGRV